MWRGLTKPIDYRACAAGQRHLCTALCQGAGLYLGGTNKRIEPNKAEGLKWLRKAAETGDAPAKQFLKDYGEY